MKTLKKVLLVIAGIIILALVVALFIKKDYAVERQITINKPKDVVFEYVKYLKNQDNYSEWNNIDPAMKKTYEGTDGTVGFKYTWDSDKKEAGKGEQTITNIVPGERIDLDLHFIEPIEANDHAYLTTASLGPDQTNMTWGFNGRMAYPMNLMLLFMDMDDMLGKDLEGGLKKLKTILEK